MVSTQATNQPPDAAPNMVLVVDDDAGLRFLISEALEQAGFAVIEAEDGLPESEVSRIALAGAEKVLKKEIDAKANSQVLNDLVAQL